MYEAEQKQHYYQYRVGESAQWWLKEPPARNLAFERELELAGGTNRFGNPILRVRWAATLLSDVAEKKTIKYKKIFRSFSHLAYMDNGQLITIGREEDAPADKIVTPIYNTIELGRLRWVVESWQSVEDAVKGGRFTDAKGEDGQRLFRTPPPEGVYNAFQFIETADKKFRDLDDEVLTAIKGSWRYNENTTVDQKIADMIADEKQEAKEDKEKARKAFL